MGGDFPRIFLRGEFLRRFLCVTVTATIGFAGASHAREEYEPLNASPLGTTVDKNSNVGRRILSNCRAARVLSNQIRKKVLRMFTHEADKFQDCCRRFQSDGICGLSLSSR